MAHAADDGLEASSSPEDEVSRKQARTRIYLLDGVSKCCIGLRTMGGEEVQIWLDSRKGGLVTKPVRGPGLSYNHDAYHARRLNRKATGSWVAKGRLEAMMGAAQLQTALKEGWFAIRKSLDTGMTEIYITEHDLSRHMDVTEYDNRISVRANLATVTVADVGEWANQMCGIDDVECDTKIFRSVEDTEPARGDRLIAHLAGIPMRDYSLQAPIAGGFVFTCDPSDPDKSREGCPAWFHVESQGGLHWQRLCREAREAITPNTTSSTIGNSLKRIDAYQGSHAYQRCISTLSDMWKQLKPEPPVLAATLADDLTQDRLGRWSVVHYREYGRTWTSRSRSHGRRDGK